MYSAKPLFTRFFVDVLMKDHPRSRELDAGSVLSVPSINDNKKTYRYKNKTKTIKIELNKVKYVSKIKLVVYYQCCVLTG